MGFSERYTTESNEETLKEEEGTIHDNGLASGGTFLQTKYFENIRPHNPSTDDWCILEDIEEGDDLTMDPACEVNEKSTREKNDGNEALEEVTSPPLDLNSNKIIDTDEETLPNAEEDWKIPSR